MPKEEERKLRLAAQKKGFGKRRANAYVFGTLRKQGWRPKRHKFGK